jgi:hypothetical protein
MTTAQLINQLQNWQAIHGVCNVIYQSSLGNTIELPVRGCVIAEDEDGSKTLVLFTQYEQENG